MITKQEALAIATRLLGDRAILGESGSVPTVLLKEGFGAIIIGKGPTWEEALVDTAINFCGMGMNGTFKDVLARADFASKRRSNPTA